MGGKKQKTFTTKEMAVDSHKSRNVEKNTQFKIPLRKIRDIKRFTMSGIGPMSTQ